MKTSLVYLPLESTLARKTGEGMHRSRAKPLIIHLLFIGGSVYLRNTSIVTIARHAN